MVLTSLALAFALVLAFAPAEPPALTSSLSKIPFANNSGTVSSTGNFLSAMPAPIFSRQSLWISPER